ncbi:O-antigen ligase family protein [Donghicola sp. C2-DW-16]|uniref:O-antigen ligase family protein n=1 Tax=Donghicola mangrovi TaxID=2729614 RepID=A0ABX2PI61_9RHOB|nr:O-antigen ligase family protein [Donghicola mangrovi]NVO29198.1 O-antigen ligase family protein [Donghicola mangrovi]
MSITEFMKVTIWVSLLVGLLSISFNTISPSGGWTGIFASKNDFAQFAASGVITGFSGLIGGLRRNIFYPSLICIALSTYLLIKADSAGALIATSGSCLIVLGIKFLGRFRGFARFFLLAFMFLVLLFVVLFVSLNLPAMQQILLDATGKDATMTGRTELWEVAFDEIEKRPIFGTGYKAYWIPGNSMAEQLWEKFGIASKQGFHFHNTIISNAVEIGIFGVLILVYIFFSSSYRIACWALNDPCSETFFVFGLTAFTLILMNTEVMFFSQFHKQTVLVIAAMAYAARLRGVLVPKCLQHDSPRARLIRA